MDFSYFGLIIHLALIFLFIKKVGYMAQNLNTFTIKFRI